MKRGPSDIHLPNGHEQYTSHFASGASCLQDVSIGYWYANFPFAFISFPPSPPQTPPPPPFPPPPNTHIWILPRKENGLTMAETWNSVVMKKVGLGKNDRPGECSVR